MLFCMDIGNTNIVLGLVEKNKVLRNWRIRTEKEITADELAILVNNLFQASDVSLGDVKDMIISCVVPPLLSTIEEFAHKYFHLKPLIVGPGIRTGMPIRYDNPKEVGADRIVNAVAAYEKYKTAMVIVDFGTATTFDYVSGDGAYMGGAIRKESGENITVVATGGLAPIICEVSETIDHVEEFLTLEGLMIIFNRNKQNP
ncbi:MAG: type III pantothenate kinase [Deltaproteobacteria bacterium]|nr:type III pantothenate kinase [Deltaproteobacteria bacterium]